MIVFRRLGGELIALNPDLIERVEATPDTVVTLVDEKKFLVEESLDQVLELIRDYRAYVIARADDLRVTETGGRPVLHVVPNDHVTSPEVIEAVGDTGVDLDFGADVEPITELAAERDWIEETIAEVAPDDPPLEAVPDGEPDGGGSGGFLGFGGGRS